MKIEYREGTIDDEKSSKKVSLEEVAPETLTTPEEQDFETRLRDIIREEIVHYNNVFMSRFGVDEDGVLHLTKKDLN